MTCREKISLEHPEWVDKDFAGGIAGCPNDYGYSDIRWPNCDLKCRECWDQEVKNLILK